MLVIVELLMAGGMFMFGILATSLVAVGIIAQRVYTLWIGFRLNVESLREKVLAHIDDGDYSKAAQLCAGKHPLQCWQPSSAPIAAKRRFGAISRPVL